ncbi:MAG: hypothetical protein AB7V16_07150 [Vulcanibacillus sp.]
MGQYKLIISFAWSLGLWFKYEPSTGIRSFSVLLPFVGIYFGLAKHASGIHIFGKDF